jgi:hypothetical protein
LLFKNFTKAPKIFDPLQAHHKRMVKIYKYLPQGFSNENQANKTTHGGKSIQVLWERPITNENEK